MKAHEVVNQPGFREMMLRRAKEQTKCRACEVIEAFMNMFALVCMLVGAIVVGMWLGS